jgi:hypothetical protein
MDFPDIKFSSRKKRKDHSHSENQIAFPHFFHFASSIAGYISYHIVPSAPKNTSKGASS